LAGTSGSSGSSGTRGTSGSSGSSGTSGSATILNEGVNRVLTSTATPGTIQAETNLTFDGSFLTVVDSAGGVDAYAYKYQYASNDQFYGEYIENIGTYSGTTGQIGKVYYLAHNGTGGALWALANGATTNTAIGFLGIVRDDGNNRTNLLVQGMASRGDYNFGTGSVGSPLYLSSSSAGGITSTRPSATGHVVRIIGYFMDSNDRTLYFNPDNTYVVR
jgi:hypothetical protein